MASLVHGVVHRAMWVFFGSVFTIVKWGGGGGGGGAFGSGGVFGAQGRGPGAFLIFLFKSFVHSAIYCRSIGFPRIALPTYIGRYLPYEKILSTVNFTPPFLVCVF